jgi:two-component system alkaline phosphatase synthesis response regulator PhoP
MIYILEDDAGIRKLVLYTLNSQGMKAEGFERPSQFWRAMEEKRPELLLLDIMLPEEDGIEVLRKLRADPRTARLPVLMLTAKSSEYDKVQGLDEGADDYISKPFGMMELLARIRTALRHAGHNTVQTQERYQIGTLFVDPGQHIVRDGEREVTLTLKEFQLLCLLLRRQGSVLSRDELLNTIWGYDFDGASRTVDVHIRTLRQKLGDSGEYIETVRGVGYKITPQ